MIDFHTHILPGIDDGSRDMDMTIRMLEAERDQGVSHICATPHFYAHRRSIDAFLERRTKAMDAVQEILEQRPDLPHITPGAEVYYFSGIERAEHLPELCLEGTNLLLLEMPFDQWTEEMVKAVEYLIHRRGMKIILAHVERYYQFQKNKTCWDRILNMPITIQLNTVPFLNAGSWLRPNKEHKLCLQLLEEYDNIIFGSDCHNMTDRAPNLAEARRIIEKKLGSKRLIEIEYYTKKLLGQIASTNE